MRALQIEKIRSPLQATEIHPRPGPGDVLVSVEAAGICRSDLHYLHGSRPVPSLPLVPGHEVAGQITAVGPGVEEGRIGERVALHYLVSCGRCAGCQKGEQFCESGEMIGLDRQGGYAEGIVIPADNAIAVPENVSMDAAAVMMCSTATVLHALRRGRMEPGDNVALLGVGGLGMSAVQVARALGANTVFAVDINPAKLAIAAELGAEPVDGKEDVVALLSPRGVDVALELVGNEELMRRAIAMLRPRGRAVAVGITEREFGLDPFRDLVRHEREVIGAADHLRSELDELLAMEASGTIDIAAMVTRTVSLDEAEVNDALDRLDGFGDDVRTVIHPG